MLTRTKTKKKN